MSEEILDDKQYDGYFRTPKTLLVAKEPWLRLCGELQRKSLIGSGVIMIIGLIISFFIPGMSGFLLIGVLVFSGFTGFSTMKKFANLRELADRSYVLSIGEIREKSSEKEKRLFLESIKYIEFHNWGIEVDTKKNPKMMGKLEEDGKMMIPCLVNDFDEVIQFFEQVQTKK